MYLAGLPTSSVIPSGVLPPLYPINIIPSTTVFVPSPQSRFSCFCFVLNVIFFFVIFFCLFHEHFFF
jgi:hypothetical protein